MSITRSGPLKTDPATREACVYAAGEAGPVFHAIVLAAASSKGATLFLNNSPYSEDAETQISSAGGEGTAGDRVKREAVR